MSTVLQLPPRPNQTAFNLRRWDELLADPYLANIEGRIETDRHGEIYMSPPPSSFHGRFQFHIGMLLKQYAPAGEVFTECPISTDDGVRAADVVWLSSERSKKTRGQEVLLIAPEICIEVLSPSNSPEQMIDKAALYFSAGAQEVWWCESDGTMRFFKALQSEVPASSICAQFPKKIEG